MATILDMDALLDATLDNVADVPDFLNPPDGLYKLAVDDAKIEEYKTKKEPNVKKTRIKLVYKVAATVDTKDTPVPDGSLFSENFTGTEDGLAYFKKQAIKILNVSDLNGVPMREILTTLKGAEFDAMVKNKKTKGEDGSEFENVNVRPIPPAA